MREAIHELMELVKFWTYQKMKVAGDDSEPEAAAEGEVTGSS